MRQKLQVIGLSVLVLTLLGANVRLALAKEWAWFHWHKGGVEQQKREVTYGLWPRSTSTHPMEVDAVVGPTGLWSAPPSVVRFREDGLAEKGPDVTIIVDNYGCTPWWGLATIIDPEICKREGHEGYGSPSVIRHVHVRYNTYWDAGNGHPNPRDGTFPMAGASNTSDVLGVLLHEVGHSLGLDHSPDFCMGKGYYDAAVATDQNSLGMQNYTDANNNFPPFP
jgi:hypothetical protein